MPLRIRHSPAARLDFREIWHYIAAANEPAADRLLRNLMATIKLAAEKPEIGRRRPELGAIRSIPRERYTIYYRADDRTLHVVRVLSAYRNVTPDMLGED